MHTQKETVLQFLIKKFHFNQFSTESKEYHGIPVRLTLFIKCSLSPVMLLTFKLGFLGSLQDVSLFSEILAPQILASWVALNSNKFFFFSSYVMRLSKAPFGFPVS